MSDSVSIQTFLQLSSNMVTTSELRQYVTAAYGTQVTGYEFTASLISSWVRNRRVPEVYGGHKILSAKVVNPFRVTVLTLDNFDRSILEDLEVLKKTIQGPKVTIPRKQRTKLYYEILKQKPPKNGLILEKAGMNRKQTVEASRAKGRKKSKQIPVKKRKNLPPVRIPKPNKNTF